MNYRTAQFRQIPQITHRLLPAARRTRILRMKCFNYRRITHMKNIRNKLTFKALTLREAAREKALALRAKALDTTGEGYVDTAVKIIIAVVIGALLMAGLVALFNEVIMPRVNTEVTELFDAAG